MLYGVFHGDLHGGNLMVRPDGRTVLMDFGSPAVSTRRSGCVPDAAGRRDEWRHDVQLGALRDLGAFPPDTDLKAVFRDLGLDRTIDPTQLSADELVHELQDLTKKLLAYGARAPKELMLFVKNMMFLDGAIARLAPDLDILARSSRCTRRSRCATVLASRPSSASIPRSRTSSTWMRSDPRWACPRREPHLPRGAGAARGRAQAARGEAQTRVNGLRVNERP